MDLPAKLELPLASGAPYWYWLGNRPALDLVNTLRERWWRRVETLVTPEDLGSWLARAELVPEPPPVDEALLRRARGLREAIDAALVAFVERRPAPDTALATISRTLAPARELHELVRGDDGAPSLRALPPANAAAHALGLVALDAARMLGTEERARIRICAADDCSARFYDRSPAGRRRWCSMRGCGNVAKARRHRATRADGAQNRRPPTTRDRDD